MDANDAPNTTIDHLFAPESQPTPPDQPSFQAPPVNTGQEPQSPVVIPPAPQLATQPDQPVEQPREAPRTVPLSELIETRRRAQAAEQQSAQLMEALQRLSQPQQPQPQPIDPISDPEGAYHALRQEMQQSLLTMHLDSSERQARVEYGHDVVDQALEAVTAAGYNQAFINRPDPYGELVTWYQGQRARQEIGDPAAYRAKLEAEVRAKVLAEMKAGATVPPNLPPSLSSATRANSAPDIVPEAGDFFKSMFARRTT